MGVLARAVEVRSGGARACAPRVRPNATGVRRRWRKNVHRCRGVGRPRQVFVWNRRAERVWMTVGARRTRRESVLVHRESGCAECGCVVCDERDVDGVHDCRRKDERSRSSFGLVRWGYSFDVTFASFFGTNPKERVPTQRKKGKQ